MRRIASALILLSILGSCKTSNSSKLEHNLNEPITASTPYLWTARTEAEFLKELQIPPTMAVAVGNPLRARLQSWSDKLNSYLRTQYPNVLDHIPIPTVVLVRSEEVNAFVAVSEVCFDNVRFSLGDKVPTQFGKTSAHVAFRDGVLWKTEGTCNHKQASADEVKSYVEYLNKHNTACQFKVTPQEAPNFVVSTTPACPLTPDLLAAKEDGVENINFEVLPTANYVLIYTGLINQLTEDQAVFAMFHELGHYYRSHATGVREPYFYHMAEENKPTAPETSEDLQKLNQDLREAVRLVAGKKAAYPMMQWDLPTGLYTRVEGQKVHTFMFKALVALNAFAKKELCAQGATSPECKACDTAMSLVDNNLLPYTTKFEGLGGPLTAAVKTSYLAFEKQTLACLQPVQPLRTAINSKLVFASTITLPFMPAKNFEASVLNLSDYLKEESATYLDDDMTYDYDADDFEKFMAMKGKIEELRAEIVKLDKVIIGANQRAHNEFLGYYTGEQEADDIALEWFTALGFDPRAAGEMNIAFIKTEEEKIACKAARELGWKDMEGKPLVLPWGPLDNVHPQSCFRSRNTDKEAAAHGYKSGSVSPTAGLQPTWASMLAALPKGTGAAPIGAAATFVARGKAAAQQLYERENFRLGCRFSQ